MAWLCGLSKGYISSKVIGGDSGSGSAIQSLISKSKLIDVVDPNNDGNKFIVDKYENIVTINADLANMSFRTLYHLKGLTGNITAGLPAIISDPVNNSDEIWIQDTDASLDNYTLTIPVQANVLINGEAKPLIVNKKHSNIHIKYIGTDGANQLFAINVYTRYNTSYVPFTGNITNAKLCCNYVLDATITGDISIGMPLATDLDESMVGYTFSVGVLYPANSLKINAPVVVNNVIILGFADLLVPMVGGAMITLTYMGYSKTLGWHLFNPTAGLKTPLLT